MCLLAVEDKLSEAVVRRILVGYAGSAKNSQVVGGGGYGFLKANIFKYINAAQNVQPVFMLTDLDQGRCPPTLIDHWFQGQEIPPRFLFRVAVREVEAWLLADREAFGAFLGISHAKIDRDVERISGPKEYVLNLARKSRGAVRRELVPAKGAVASQGFGYNACLGNFVEKEWSPERASENSSSLKKTLIRTEAWVKQFVTIDKV